METLRDLDIVRALPPSAVLRADSGATSTMPTMTVRFSQFDTWYEIDSMWEGRFLERTGLDLSPIRTHSFPLEEAVSAFELGKQADKCIKVTLLNS